MKTRMHSSRMHTACSSSCLLWGGCLPQCILGYPHQLCTWRPPSCGPGDLLGVGLETPPHVGLETPQARSLNFPVGVGLETPQARPLNSSIQCGPGDPTLARLLNFPPGYEPGDLQCMLGYHPHPTHPLCAKNDRHV